MNQRRTKVVSYKQYTAGWLDSSIHDFLQAFPLGSTKTKYALITCLDSNLDPSSLLRKSPELAPLVTQAQSLGRGLLIPTKRLLEVESHNQIFFGFDEIWFFENKIIEPKPDSAWLVGPARVDQEKMYKLGTWMLANRCSMALGDGEGLNVIVKAMGLVRYLLCHSISQPPPALGNGWEVEEEKQRRKRELKSGIGGQSPLLRGGDSPIIFSRVLGR